MTSSATASPAAITLTVGERTWTLDEGHLTALRWGHGRWCQPGDATGRIVASGGTLEERELREVLGFIAVARASFDEQLRAYDQGKTKGNLRLGDRALFALIDELGLRYRKSVARYVKGKKGQLDRYDEVIFLRGHTDARPGAIADTIGDLRPAVEALERLDHAVTVALGTAGKQMEVQIRDAYEYF